MYLTMSFSSVSYSLAISYNEIPVRAYFSKISLR